ncbi:MAG: HAD-IB family hydrolase [Flavobacteriales bacterium]|jgi:HAD superfamily hydrolase (TIGR01490 family)|nr:HAD-IB family hydrolase [Flavobacteriales bacterium]
MSAKTSLALFDFDGTISSKDSFVAFMKFTHGKPVFIMRMAMGFLTFFGWKIGLVKSHFTKVKALRSFYKGWTEEQMTDARKLFTKEVIPTILFPKAIERINWHKEQGHRVIVVTASCDAWLRDWTIEMNLELLCTEMELKNGLYTGELSKPNCRGKEKVSRVKQHLNLEDYQEVYAYGNDHGDKQMLAIADHPHFREFEG